MIWKDMRGKLKDKAEASQLTNGISADGQKRFVDSVMEDEGVDRETALRWCLAQSD